MNSYQKRRKPGYYSYKSKKPRSFTLEPGLKGFICTCNIREKDCIREAYNVLNEYADQIYGDEKGTQNGLEESANETREFDDEIETALNNEIESIKAESKKNVDVRRFQVVESGANNCLFIRTNLDDPVGLVQHIVKDIEASRKQKTRFLLRMIPIEVTCKAYIDDIKEKVAELFDKYFTKEEKTFSIIINRRNSSMLSRDETIAELAEMIKMRNINNRVDLKQPQLTVVIEIIRSMCCIGILPDYFRFRKYNLLELASPEGKRNEKNAADKDSSGDAVLPGAEKTPEENQCSSVGGVDTSVEDIKSQISAITEEQNIDDYNESTENSEKCEQVVSQCQQDMVGNKESSVENDSQDAVTALNSNICTGKEESGVTDGKTESGENVPEGAEQCAEENTENTNTVKE